jgi:pyridoxine kinase
VAGIEVKQRRILIVQDISGAGSCSALVVLPVLSLAGLSCSLLPTAYFSTHTGGFGPVHRRDLSEDMRATLAHWERLDFRFDAVYIGYAASPEQLGMLEKALPGLMEAGAKLYIDPVMGDRGRRYAFCGEELIAGFKTLCAKADIIFPNLTEAALLLGMPLIDGKDPAPPEPGRLSSICGRSAVLTGIRDGQGGIGVRAESAFDAPQTVFRPEYESSYPGTGDLLASCVIAAVMLGASLPLACDIACDFLDEAFRRTVFIGGDPRSGLVFEPSLKRLAQAFESIPAHEEY